MIAEWDTKRMFVDRVRGRNKNRTLKKRFRGINYKRGVIWLRKSNPVRELKNLQRFLKMR
jgi:hypothetical protein